MAPIRRSRAVNGSSHRRLRGQPATRQSKFTASRLENQNENLDVVEDSEGEELHTEVPPVDESDTEHEAPARYSHAELLRALDRSAPPQEPARKRRKPNPLSLPDSGGSHSSRGAASVPQQQSEPDTDSGILSRERTILEAGLHDQKLSDESRYGSPDILQQPHTSFSQHFDIDSEALASKIAMYTKHASRSRSTDLEEGFRKSVTCFNESDELIVQAARSKGLIWKSRLAKAAGSLQASLNRVERDLLTTLSAYQDVVLGARNIRNASVLRDASALHILNHVFQTRDRVIKNNSKLAQVEDGNLEFRDQGFTRPKVLVLLPTREACFKWVNTLIQLSGPEQQENKARFADNFHAEDDETWRGKPADFRDLFAGSIDDDFRVGIKFTRKTIKFFSSFYNSDIILASALGLVQAIDGTSKKDKKAQPDSDFLSSIELAIIDNATAIQMQNWRHIEHIFEHLNLLPKDSHGCDFSRVRTWYLNGHSKYLRQTIILSDFLTPEINSLITQKAFNIAGLAKYSLRYRGAMLESAPSILPGTLTQIFVRFHSPSPATDSDTRFTHFTNTMLPSLLRSKHSSSSIAQKGTLVYVPDYAAFLRLRNHLNSQTSMSFTAVSEYTSAPELARARSHFLSGRYALMLITERLQHFRRLTIKGVRQVVFYGLPENPVFWGEIVGWTGTNDEYERAKGKEYSAWRDGKGRVRALFSKWDAMKLERVVGSDRVGRLVGGQGRDGDVFEFT